MKDIWLTILGTILLHLSAGMRELVVENVKAWEAKAKETKSPCDDIFVAFVKCIFLIP